MRHFFAWLLLVPGICPVAGADCRLSDQMNTGGGQGVPWYSTVAPSEHYDSVRSQLFPDACTLQQITGVDSPAIAVRRAPGTYEHLYNVATRDKGELFVYGGYPGQGGSYVARIDPATLAETWRAVVTIPSTQWSFIGAMGVLGDGYVYSIQSNVLAKVDPASGAAQLLALPQIDPPTGTGAAYNGFVVNPEGLIFAKSMERGPCDRDDSGGLDCVLTNRLPSTLVVVDPSTMSVLTSIQTPEPALGRITTERHDGADYLYVPCVSGLRRYRYAEGRLALDESWGPVAYGSTGANASGVGVLGDYVVVQTNYVPSTTPSWIIAAHIRDSGQQFAMQAFTALDGGYVPASWVPDKAALDAENGMIYAEDMYAGQVAGIALDDAGFRVVWKISDIAKGFPFLVGPASQRQLVVPQLVAGGDTLAWRDAATGALLARSPGLTSIPTVGTSAPGFEGRVYYPSFNSNELFELTPQRP